MSELLVPVGVSNRHLHLSEQDLAKLFGEGHALTFKKELKQTGQFAAEEVVDLVGPKGTINKVRVLGPVRKQTQIEVALTDAFKLGLKPPVRESGDLANSPGITLVGPKGKLELAEGVIVAARHIHMTPEDAKNFGVKDKDVVKARFGSARGLVFENVVIRVHESYRLEFHVDTDEANASQLFNNAEVEIIK